MSDVTKRCRICELDLLTSEFNIAKRNKSGFAWACKKCANELSISRTAAVRYDVLVHYSQNPPRCAICGETNVVCLAIDHVNGGGGKHFREIGGSLAQWLKRNEYPEGYRILCHNCNAVLGFYGCSPEEGQARFMERVYAFRSRPCKGTCDFRHLTKEQVKTIRERFKSGERSTDLARKYGVTGKTVRKKLMLHRRKLDSDEITEIKRRWENGEKVADLAVEFGIGVKMIYRNCGWDQPTPKRNYITVQQVIEIKSRLYANELPKLLATEFEVSECVISSLFRGKTFKNIGIDMGTIDHDSIIKNRKTLVIMPHKLSKEKEDEVAQLLSQCVRQRDIAKQFGVSKSTVSNIKRRINRSKH